MASCFAKVSEEEIEEAFFYPSDLVNTKTTTPLRVGEERWIYTSTLPVSVYNHPYSPPLRGIVVYYQIYNFTAVIIIFIVVIIWQQPQSFNLVSGVLCMVKIFEFLLFFQSGVSGFNVTFVARNASFWDAVSFV